MEGVIINELSLQGQFDCFQDFCKSGLPPFCEALKEAYDVFGVTFLYKRGDLYNAQATPDMTVQSILKSLESRVLDEMKKFKSILARAINNEPFWDAEPKQDMSADYFMGEQNVSGTSVAEAAARSSCLLSFVRSQFDAPQINITKNGLGISVPNIWKGKQLYSILFEKGAISLAQYICTRFDGSKLNFSHIDNAYGFNLIDALNQDEFIDAFRKFEELEWPSIATDSGLDYKRYNKNSNSKHYFSEEHWSKGLMKFRVTRRSRCFGYVENGVFYVLRFDINHELSNLG